MHAFLVHVKMVLSAKTLQKASNADVKESTKEARAPVGIMQFR